MTNFRKLCFVVVLWTTLGALFTPALYAANKYVYVNLAASPNGVEGFQYPGNNYLTNTLVAITSWPSGSPAGNSFDTSASLKDQVIFPNVGGLAGPCLYLAEPLTSVPFSNGDIAVFTGANTGTLTWAGSFATPNTIPNTYSNGIALANGQSLPALYAGYSASAPGTNYIAVWKINPATCGLTFSTQLAVAPLHGGSIDGMAESANNNTLVVSYYDGSIQSFSTPAYGIVPSCATAINSTGYTNQGSWPAGVDITRDGLWAIFGDVSGGGVWGYVPHGPTEVESIKLPITCASFTIDYGGTAVASGVNLGSFINSENVRLGPGERNLFVTNNGAGNIGTSMGITTVRFNEFASPQMGLAGAPGNPACTTPYTNPTPLRVLATAFLQPFFNGMETSDYTSSNVLQRIYVGEIGNLSNAIGLVDMQLGTGCTVEAPNSPFVDASYAGWMLNVWPPRPF